MEVLPVQHSVPAATPLSPTRLHRITTNTAQPQLISAPTSQESVLSADSTGSSDPFSLRTSISDLSQNTALSELSSSGHAYAKQDFAAMRFGLVQQRARTPEETCEATSPMSVMSPPMHGTKRTASGHIKNVDSINSIASYATTSSRRTRAESMSSTTSRVSDLAASLKMRLGYAMTKVQHGWEHKNINELERMTTPASDIARPRTAYAYDFARDQDDLISLPPKRRSGMFGAAQISTPRLEPAAEFHVHQDRTSVGLKPVPSRNNDIHAMSPPRTPATVFPRRPPTIRTDTQTAEAERDALQALTQLGSPHNSQYSRHHNVSQANSSQASPLRADFRRSNRMTFARGDSASSGLSTRSEEDSTLQPELSR